MAESYIKSITFTPNKNGLYKVSNFIINDIIKTTTINNEQLLFSQLDNFILFSYQGTLNQEQTLVLTTTLDETDQVLSIEFFATTIAQKTPDNAKIEDYNPFFGLVRIASDQETNIGTLGNENGCVVTPKQVFDIVTKGNYLKKWKNDSLNNTLEEAPQEGDLSFRLNRGEDKKKWCIYTYRDGVGQWEPLSNQPGEKGSKGDKGTDGINGEDGAKSTLNGNKIDLDFTLEEASDGKWNLRVEAVSRG